MPLKPRPVNEGDELAERKPLDRLRILLLLNARAPQEVVLLPGMIGRCNFLYFFPLASSTSDPFGVICTMYDMAYGQQIIQSNSGMSQDDGKPPPF